MRGTEAAVWIGGYDFSRMISQIDLTIDVGEAERTHLASTAQEYLPLLPKASVSFNGYYDNAEGYPFEIEILNRLGEAATLLTVLFKHSEAACLAYVFPNCSGLELAIGTPASGLITLNGKLGPVDLFWRGLRIWSGTLSATGATSSVDFGTGTTQGGNAALHISAIDGTAINGEIRIESSTNGVDWTNEGSIFFSAIGGYGNPLVGSIGRYVRANLVSLGGATSITGMIIVGLEAN